MLAGALPVLHEKMAIVAEEDGFRHVRCVFQACLRIFGGFCVLLLCSRFDSQMHLLGQIRLGAGGQPKEQGGAKSEEKKMEGTEKHGKFSGDGNANGRVSGAGAPRPAAMGKLVALQELLGVCDGGGIGCVCAQHPGDFQNAFLGI